MAEGKFCKVLWDRGGYVKRFCALALWKSFRKSGRIYRWLSEGKVGEDVYQRPEVQELCDDIEAFLD